MSNATNVQGAITGAVNKPEEKKGVTPATIMKNLLDGKQTKEMLDNMLRDQAGSFAASLIDIYRSDNYLQQCPANEVLAEATRAVGFGLPITKALGFVWIVPRRDKNGQWHPTFQLGYKGMLQLAIRSGAYRHINADAVYEGESVAVNRLTGSVEIAGEAKSDKAIGYFAYFCTYSGFEKALYMTVEQVKEYAEKYSDSYKSGAAIWRKEFDSMATKTVLRRLLSRYGLFSVANEAAQKMGEQIAEEEASDFVVEVDETTGEAREAYKKENEHGIA